jgi:hypothetical protein
MMEFEGKVQFRSSVRLSGPPGETEVLRLNPQREKQILEVTGWKTLKHGSLNLAVDNNVLDKLLMYTPAFVEPGESIIYPERFQHIPKMRVEYYYYTGVARVGENSQPVLVRRAKNPVRGRVELFAPVKLTEHFNIIAGDNVTVEIKGF